jgi:DNA-binding transcriptional MocR family regulator
VDDVRSQAAGVHSAQRVRSGRETDRCRGASTALIAFAAPSAAGEGADADRPDCYSTKIILHLLQHIEKEANASSIAAAVEAAVASGALAPGAPLPTVRSLARDLRVSPTTVAGAYGALKARGLVATDGRRGTTVARQPPLRVRPARSLPHGVRDLWSGNPAPALLPPLKRALSQVDSQHKLYGGPTKHADLVELARADFRADGIKGDVAIVGGGLDGIERVLQAQLKPGDRVAVEDPSWPRIADLLYALGLRPVPVSLDDNGLKPDALARALHLGVKAMIATPRGQNPTGAAIDSRRATALRAILRLHRDVLVIEDDYVAAVSGAPYCGVHGSTCRWTVIRSLSKVLGPDLRIAPIAGDALTISQVEGRQTLGSGWVSHILQQTAANLWHDALDRGLLARAERVYTERRDALVTALAAYGLTSFGRSGFGAWVPLQEEVAVVQLLLEEGWAVSPGERYRFNSPPGIRITTTALEPREAAKLAAALAAALQSSQVAYAA